MGPGYAETKKIVRRWQVDYGLVNGLQGTGQGALRPEPLYELVVNILWLKN